MRDEEGEGQQDDCLCESPLDLGNPEGGVALPVDPVDLVRCAEQAQKERESVGDHKRLEYKQSSYESAVARRMTQFRGEKESWRSSGVVHPAQEDEESRVAGSGEENHVLY